MRNTTPAGRTGKRTQVSTPQSKTRLVETPARQQDGTDFGLTLEQNVFVTQVVPIETRVEVLEAALALVSANVIVQADLELQRGRRSGTVTLEGTFSEDDIGQPVVIVQAASSRVSDGEAGIVQFVGMVEDARRMRIAWTSDFPAPRHVRINYLIGRGATL